MSIYDALNTDDDDDDDVCMVCIYYPSLGKIQCRVKLTLVPLRYYGRAYSLGETFLKFGTYT